MLSEQFITSVLHPASSPKNGPNSKDASVQVHTIHPSHKVQASFKNSSTRPNCLAVSSTHIFAAQADTAVVHVYSRDRGNQEAVVALPERLSCLSFAGDNGGAGVMVLGTEKGRLILWEVGTGRNISTAASHLQPVSAIAISPDNTHILTGSEDSDIHVWSLPSLLSFSSPTLFEDPSTDALSPLLTLSNHRDAITSLVVGHSTKGARIAVSASRDSSCIVWDYLTGDLLHTYLVSSIPRCLAIDPCDRGFYVGLDTGSVELVDFFDSKAPSNPLFNGATQSTASQATPMTHQRLSADSGGATLALGIVYEGNALLSGHADGKICLWDVATRSFSKEVVELNYPVTNLLIQQPEGFLNASEDGIRTHMVVKPRANLATNDSAHVTTSPVPASYVTQVQFLGSIENHGPPTSFLTTKTDSTFLDVLHHSSFPPELIQSAIAAIQSGSDLSVAVEMGPEIGRMRAEIAGLKASKKYIWDKMIAMTQDKVNVARREKAVAEMEKTAKKVNGRVNGSRSRHRGNGDSMEIDGADRGLVGRGVTGYSSSDDDTGDR